MKKPLKLKPDERDAMIQEIMDYWFNYAGQSEMLQEIENIYKHGLQKDFVPYAKRTDEELVSELFSTFDGTTYEDYLEVFTLTMWSELRAKKMANYYWRKHEEG